MQVLAQSGHVCLPAESETLFAGALRLQANQLLRIAGPFIAYNQSGTAQDAVTEKTRRQLRHREEPGENGTG